jgi:hypothetical protein
VFRTVEILLGQLIGNGTRRTSRGYIRGRLQQKRCRAGGRTLGKKPLQIPFRKRQDAERSLILLS